MTVADKISKVMSRASRARSPKSRKQGGKTAWKTRLANLRAKLARLEARKSISGISAGK